MDDAKLSDKYCETALSMINVFSKLHYLYHNSEEIFQPEVVFGDWTAYNYFNISSTGSASAQYHSRI